MENKEVIKNSILNDILGKKELDKSLFIDNNDKLTFFGTFCFTLLGLGIYKAMPKVIEDYLKDRFNIGF